MTFRDQLALAYVCAATAALTACSPANPEAGRPSTTPITPSSTATATQTSTSPTRSIPTAAPARPKEAEGLTLASAEAFYRHYVDLMNYSSQTGETTELRAASEPGCEGCKEYADFVAKINEANGGLSGDYRERIKEVNELVRGTSGRIGGSAIITVGNYTTKQSPTAKPIVSKAAEYTDEIALAANNGSWVMYEMKLEER